MPKRRLLWQLFPSYIVITFISLIVVTWYAINLVRDIYIQKKRGDLESRAHLIEQQVKDYLFLSQYAYLDSLSKEIGPKSSTRITVILTDGLVIADSERDPTTMDNHINRPEIKVALQGKVGTSIRYSQTLQKELMYVAIPLKRNQTIDGVLRTSVPITFIEDTLKIIQTRIIIVGVVTGIILTIVSLLVSRRIGGPLEEMEKGVLKFAQGDLSHRLKTPKSAEMARLVEALNIMAAQVDEKIKTVIEQKNEQQAVLESMVEGVIAVDSFEKIINLNQAAAKLLHIKSEEGMDLHIRDAIKNEDLKLLISKTLRGNEPIEGEILMRNQSEYYLQVHGTVLMNASKQIIGALIVLNDVTRLRRLENVRRDFVANVSHEIRTPLTSIKGFAETLLDGALENSEDARNFLKIIVKQANRLNAIIEDLLILATLEEQEERSDVQFVDQKLKHVLENALQVCLPAANKKNIQVELKCDGDLKIHLNKPLIEQAVINLIDNAIKYSPENSKVEINTLKNSKSIEIIVQDQGVGIAKIHLPRIFERFYRVDKARSRAVGGTGLGLAIVKHIAQVHDGHVSVDSILGKGSTFKIHLPV